MKKILAQLTAITSLIISATVFAGDLTIPNTFTAGTKAVASEVNDNFSAVKNSVDDNHQRISVNESSISSYGDRVSNIESGYVTGEGDLSIALTGVVTISSTSTQLLGTGTLFTSELEVGDAIKVADEVHEVAGINSNTDLTLASVHVSGALDITAYKDANLLSVKTGAGEERLTLDKSGNLAVSGSVNGLMFSRMSIYRTGAGDIFFKDAEGVQHSLSITDYTVAIGNTKIFYSPTGGPAGNSILLFNISSSPSMACTLLHFEDDLPHFGIAYATDGGNTTVAQTAWGNFNTPTFMFSTEGIANSPAIAAYASYQIMCF